MKKLFHLQLTQGSDGRATLVCWLENGSIKYVFYSGWSSDGTPYSLSNLQCTLPVDKISAKETERQFVNRVIGLINTKSVYRVANEVNCNITFKP